MASYVDYGYTTAQASHTTNYLLPPLFRLLKELQSRTILDAGCGNGSLTARLLDAGYDAYGIDASAMGIAIARQHHGAERFFEVDVESNRLPAALSAVRFDTVLSTEVVEHLYSPQKFIGFCSSVLPAGGRLIITTPYHGYWKNLALAVSGKWDAHHGPLWEGGHIKFFSRRSLGRLMEDAGFRVTHFYGAGRAPFFWKSMVMAGVKHA